MSQSYHTPKNKYGFGRKSIWTKGQHAKLCTETDVHFTITDQEDTKEQRQNLTYKQRKQMTSHFFNIVQA